MFPQSYSFQNNVYTMKTEKNCSQVLSYFQKNLPYIGVIKYKERECSGQTIVLIAEIKAIEST